VHGRRGSQSIGYERYRRAAALPKSGELHPDLPYNRGSMKATKPLTINSIDVDNDEELDALMDQVLAEGDKIYEAQYQEALRLGIIDEKGRLLKHELPEDMREDAGTDFGG
jgi:hypothetical protein